MATEKEFLNAIQSDDADVRFAAWRAAGEQPASVIGELGKIAASENPGVAKAAREALTTMTHSVGKETSGAKRPAVVKGLLALASDAAMPVRVHAYRLLSNIAPADAVDTIAGDIGDPELREEVVYCLERIPGSASISSLISAYSSAADEFKPRILMALGHRRASEAVDLCVEAMRSSNTEIAVAAVKAYGRIGKKSSAAPSYPGEGGLSDWQKIDRMDSLLRYADAQAADGNIAEAMTVYRQALAAPEEHWQCAAIIGIAKIGTAEAASAIFDKLESEDSTVRITARKAWTSMAKMKI